MKTFHVWITILEESGANRIVNQLINNHYSISAYAYDSSIVHCSDASIASVLVFRAGIDKIKNINGVRDIIPTAKAVNADIVSLIKEFSYLSIVVVSYDDKIASWNCGNILPVKKQEDKLALAEVEAALK